MQKNYTSRLFYKKYPYKITFHRTGNIDSKSWMKEWTPHNCIKLLERKKIDFRVYTKIKIQKRKRQVTVNMSLFVGNQDEYDYCIKKWNKFIDSVTEPYNQTHVDILKDNTHIVIREKLIYQRYKYVVNFRRTWRLNVDDINAWIASNFKNALAIQAAKYVGYGWNPRLYLANEEDLVLVKLTWAERIRQITVVRTLNELSS